MSNTVSNKTNTSPEQSSTKVASENSTRSFVIQIINGDFMKRDFYINNLLFFFFLFGLIFLTIAKQYFVNDLIKTTEKKQKMVEQMTSDYVSLKTRLEEGTERLRLTEKLENYGLKETVKPTKVIRIKEKK
jgi:Bacteriodetes cell division protein (FtsL-like)